jgi:regulator of sigma E protease
MEIVIKITQLILSLSLLVVLHEMGHFLLAKLFKTRVEKFYLFFDPWFSLFKYKKGETEYGIGWLPLGGYVKIAGMIDESMDKEQLKQPPQPYEFRAKPTWQRLLIMIGGVLVNFLAALFIFWMLLYTYGEQYVPVKNATYGLYFDPIAHEIGLQDGDIVQKVDTFTIDLPVDITRHLLLSDSKTLTVKRGDSTFVMSIPAGFGKRILGAGIKNFADLRLPFVVDSVIPNMPAAIAGFHKGDSLISINGESASFYNQFVTIVGEQKGKTVAIKVQRGASQITLNCKVTDKGKVGIGNRNPAKYFKFKTVTYSFWGAFPAGIDKGLSVLVNYVKQLKLVFTKEGVSQIGGFGTMGSLFSPVWDWGSFWSLTALISMVLAFMNILPIPALDGGHVIFLLYEMITGRKPGDKFLENAQIVGMVLLFSLLLFANGNDIFKGLKHFFVK